MCRCCFDTATFYKLFEVKFIFKYAQGAHVIIDNYNVENIQLENKKLTVIQFKHLINIAKICFFFYESIEMYKHQHINY